MSDLYHAQATAPPVAARPGEVRTSSAMAPQPLTPGNVTYNSATGRLTISGLGYQLACPNTLSVSWTSGPVANTTDRPSSLPPVNATGQIGVGAPWPANASELNPVATVLIGDRIARWRRTNGIAPPPNEGPLHIPAAAAAPGMGGPSPPMQGQGQGQGQQYQGSGQSQQYQGSGQGQQYQGQSQQGQGQQYNQGQGQQNQGSDQGQGQQNQGQGQGQGQQSGGQGQGSSSPPPPQGPDDARSRATPPPNGSGGQQQFPAAQGGGAGNGGGSSGYNGGSPMSSGVSAQSTP